MNNHNDDKEQKSIVAEKLKQTAKKKAGKAGKKLLKKVAKQAVKAAAKALLSALKAGLAFLIGIASPYLLIGLLIMFAIIVIYVATTLIFSFGDEELLGDSYKLKAYIEEKVYDSIDYNRLEQRDYMLPVELVISVMQIYESEKRDATSKEAVDVIVEKLKPEFTYEDREGYIESYTTTCDDDGCHDSGVTKTPYTVNMLTNVIAWNGNSTFNIEEYMGEWNSSTSSSTYTTTDKDGNKTSETVTTTHHSRALRFNQTPNYQEDYAYYEKVLMSDPFHYKRDDLIMVEALYQATGGHINYSAWKNGMSLSNGGGYDIGGDVNVIPGAGVPAEYMQYYLAGQKRFGVDWYYLAAFHWVETKFSTHQPMISSAGAEGHMQFMPCSWMGWAYPGCMGTNGYVNASTETKESVAVIKQYGGYGIDADGDGKASMWSLADAIMTTAYYMNKNGFSTDVNKAIRAYNHSDSYVSLINKKAKEFKEAASILESGGSTGPPSELGFIAPTRGRITSSWGNRELSGSPDFHAALDIANDLGTKVVAIADGTVTSTHTGCGWGGLGNTCGYGWGNHVRITHVIKGVTYESIYGHLSQVNVGPNRTVKAGEVIGLMGSSGSSTNPHLHIELHQPKRPPGSIANALNPLYYLPPIPK
ncbi:peptidoglycan DD-metalloendopeptidase family protein [Lysinibacillus xylanilyticus]|uniref:peptidoglycan DD-metalloendopeptidase family protein n=1 Tax=Lysinibacillus xylanilyticus TaxID=582475 RepID=UPI0037F4CAE2